MYVHREIAPLAQHSFHLSPGPFVDTGGREDGTHGGAPDFRSCSFLASALQQHFPNLADSTAMLRDSNTSPLTGESSFIASPLLSFLGVIWHAVSFTGHCLVHVRCCPHRQPSPTHHKPHDTTHAKAWESVHKACVKLVHTLSPDPLSCETWERKPKKGSNC